MGGFQACEKWRQECRRRTLTSQDQEYRPYGGGREAEPNQEFPLPTAPQELIKLWRNNPLSECASQSVQDVFDQPSGWATSNFRLSTSNLASEDRELQILWFGIFRLTVAPVSHIFPVKLVVPCGAVSGGEASMSSNEKNAIEINERRVGEVTVLEVRGRLALGEGSQALHEKLEALVEQGRVKLLLECSEVTALDSQGVSALVRGVISTRKRGGQMKLLKPSQKAHYVLEITRLLTIIECFDDEAKALASFQ